MYKSAQLTASFLQQVLKQENKVFPFVPFSACLWVSMFHSGDLWRRVWPDGTVGGQTSGRDIQSFLTALIMCQNLMCENRFIT